MEYDNKEIIILLKLTIKTYLQFISIKKLFSISSTNSFLRKNKSL